jgi:hypothetical protein
VYLSPAYRAAGVRRVFVGRLREPRPHYRVLGALLLGQVALATALWARRAQQRAQHAPGAARHAVMLVRADARARGCVSDRSASADAER